MCVDLRLLPFYDDGEDEDSIDVLSLSRKYNLFGAIVGLEEKFGHEVNKYFKSFNSTTRSGRIQYGITAYNGHGDRLKYVMASHLKTLIDHPGVTHSERNRRAWAYIAACPDNLKIALYWY